MALLALAPAAGAQASFTWLPGPAREVSRGTSASRDTPVIEVAYGPLAQASVGAEFGLFSVRTSSATVRQGWYGLLALENHDVRWLFPANQLWRGLLGLNVSVSLDAWALRHLGEGGAFELTLAAGHESDHATDGPNPFPPRPEVDVPDGGAGNYVSGEAAVRLQSASWRLITRLQHRVYLEGNFVHGPLADAELTRLGFGRLEPFLAVHTELLVSDQRYPDARRLRVMGGVALPGKAGRFSLFGALTAGSGYGLLINRREAQLSAGLRVSLH